MIVTINGEVVDLAAQVEQVKNATEDVTLVINSPGGDVFEGLQMVKAIENCPHKVTAKVEVMAASIAAIVALACDRVVIGKNDIMMLHNSWTFASGNKEELQSCIDAMKAIDTVLHNVIGEHCQDKALLDEVDAGDVWLVGEEVATKFDHVELVEVGTQNRMAACASLAKLVLMAKESEAERKRRKKKNVPPPQENNDDDDDENSGSDDNTGGETTGGEGGGSSEGGGTTEGGGGESTGGEGGGSEGGDGGTDDPPAGDSTPSGKYTKELKALLLEADTLE